MSKTAKELHEWMNAQHESGVNINLADIYEQGRRDMLQHVHKNDQWREGGNHPNTSTIDKCGLCTRLLEGP